MTERKKLITQEVDQQYAYNSILPDATKDSYDMTSPIIDQILDRIGYNIFTMKKILLVSTVLAVEGMQFSLFSAMLIPLTKYYNLSQSQIQILSSSLFVGVGTGSLVSGYATQTFGRPLIINLFLFCNFILTLFFSIADNYFIFLCIRYLIGFSTGVIVPMSINLLTEYLPIRLRSFTLTAIWISFIIGAMVLLLFQLTLMPNYEVQMINRTILLCSSVPFVAFIFNFFCLRDSPRNLILRGFEDDGWEILRSAADWNFSLNLFQKERAINEVKEGSNKELSSSLSEIFSSKFFKLTLLLSCIWMINSIVSYGPLLIISLTMKNLGNAEVTISNREIIISQLLINIIICPSNILGGILSEISFLGRNKSTIICLVVGFFFVTLMILIPSHYTIFFAISSSFIGMAFSINTAYSCEVYPTKIRDQAVGFLFCTTRVGGFISQILYIYLHSRNMWLPYHLTLLLLAINISFLYKLPYETYGKPLDLDYNGKSLDKDQEVNTEPKCEV